MAIPQYFERAFIAHINALEPTLSALRELGQNAGFQSAVWNKVEVAIEEALVNIIHYAYHPEKSGWIFLSCKISSESRVEFIIKDMGKPFNPEVSPKQKQPAQNIEDVEIGGLGLLLMHSYMDRIEYHREDGLNVLYLEKKL